MEEKKESGIEISNLSEELNQLSDNFEKNKSRMKVIAHLLVENLMGKKSDLSKPENC